MARLCSLFIFVHNRGYVASHCVLRAFLFPIHSLCVCMNVGYSRERASTVTLLREYAYYMHMHT